MSSRPVRRALPALALLAVAACGDQPRGTSPLAPGDAPRAALTGTAACLKGDALFLQQEIATLFSDPRLRQQARGYEGTVETRCTSAIAQAYPASTATATLATAPAAAVAYTEWLLGRRGQAGYIASDAFLWTYLTRLFGYVGYTFPSSSLGFDASGFVRICRSGETCTIESADGRRGVRIPPGALYPEPGVPFLVTGLPVECTAFSSFSIYTIYGGCLQISVDPKVGTSFQLRAPGTVVEMCTTSPGTPFYVHQRRTDVYTGQITTQGKLGQRSERPGGALSPISFRPYAPGFLDDRYCDVPRALATPGALAALRDAGLELLNLFRPKVAHAGHGGLGTLPGFAEEFSYFGPLDGYAFNGDFERDTVNTFPKTWNEMRGGSWTLSTGPNPSNASVQFGAPFGSQFVRLDQGGGNAAGKAPLTFTGTLAVPMAPQPGDGDRRIRIRFRAAVATSRALGARFDAVTSAGATIATFEFRDGTSAQSGTIHAVVPTGATLVGSATSTTWSQNAIRDLQVTIHFDVTLAQATVLVGVVGQAPLARYTLPLGAVPDLASVRWILGGRDGVTMLSDDYQLFDAPEGQP